jgi:two-component system, chemotaxis family, chemotaxis protein CheY
MPLNAKNIEDEIKSAKVLIVDDEFYIRKVIRTLLLSVGVTDVHDAGDGASGLGAISGLDPDVVILDWQMAGMDGPEFVRRVRSPETFPFPNVPIIMLTGHSEHSRVVEAMRLGVHEFLLKPVSAKALYERLGSVLVNPRPMARRASYYGPAPRKLPRPTPEPQTLERHSEPRMQARAKPQVDWSGTNVIVVD